MCVSDVCVYVPVLAISLRLFVDCKGKISFKHERQVNEYIVNRICTMCFMYHVLYTHKSLHGVIVLDLLVKNV